MKRVFTILVAVLLSAFVFAQTPEKMSYQAVIRNSSDALVTNTQIGMEINIRQGSPTGTIVYTETQTPTTNANGLVSIEIGGGTGFSTINWVNGPYFIETKTDIAGGTNYTITGTSQLLSVPYALHSKTAETITGGIAETDPIFGASPANGITSGDISNWNNKLDTEVDGSVTNELQTLSISNDTVYLSNGGFVKLPAGFDGQYSSLTGTPTNVSVFTNDAGYLTSEVDGSVTNELQTLSISNDTVYLSNGGFVKLPAGFDGQYSSLTGTPTNVSAFTNDAGYINTYTEQDTIIWKKNGNDIYYLVGNVGIGIANPTVALDVYGGISSKYSNGEIVSFSTPGGFPGVVLIDTTLNIRADMKLNNSGSVLFSTGTNASGTPGQTNHLTIKNNGNIGIGNTDPQAKLDIQGTVKIVDGTQGAGKVLTSDANGNASWQTISSGTTSQNWQVFSSNGTFTVPAGVTRLLVEAWGAGGGGGGGYGRPLGGSAGGGGGGSSGSYSKRYVTVTPGQIINITVGIGGTGGIGGTPNNCGTSGTNGGETIFGSLLTVPGGKFGTGGCASTGGIGGAAVGNGSAGGNGGPNLPPYNAGGSGGNGGSVCCGGPVGGRGGVIPPPYTQPYGTNGGNGDFGAGGGGGSGAFFDWNNGGNGGNGGDGLVIVYW